MGWLLPQGVSTYAADIDRLYYIILFITGVVFVLTEALLVYFLVRYRKREGRRAAYIHGSTKAEVIWTVVPFIIVVALGLMSKGLWDSLKDPAHFPADAYEIEVVARQFEWEVRYPGGDGLSGDEAGFTVLNRMHVPAGRPVVVHLESEDVIHSFSVPDFRVKQDAVPGMRISLWFEVPVPGEYPVGCAELCGLGHYRMSGSVVVMPESEFGAWEAERMAQTAVSTTQLAATDGEGEDR
ncbi:MAG: cytochrome c oxidase subunit II [Gemmatimonadota bacterium]